MRFKFIWMIVLMFIILGSVVVLSEEFSGAAWTYTPNAYTLAYFNFSNSTLNNTYFFLDNYGNLARNETASTHNCSARQTGINGEGIYCDSVKLSGITINNKSGGTWNFNKDWTMAFAWDRVDQLSGDYAMGAPLGIYSIGANPNIQTYVQGIPTNSIKISSSNDYVSLINTYDYNENIYSFYLNGSIYAKTYCDGSWTPADIDIAVAGTGYGSFMSGYYDEFIYESRAWNSTLVWDYLNLSNNTHPTYDRPEMNSSNEPYNYSNLNLTIYNMSTNDNESDTLFHSYVFKENGNPIPIAFFPFDSSENPLYDIARNSNVGIDNLVWIRDEGVGGSGCMKWQYNTLGTFNFTPTANLNGTGLTISTSFYGDNVGTGYWFINRDLWNDQYGIAIWQNYSDLNVRGANGTHVTFSGVLAGDFFEWHQFTFRYTNNNISLFKDGTYFGSGIIKEINGTRGNHKICVGGYGASCNSYNPNGRFDNIGFYNYSLSDEQIYLLGRNMSNTLSSHEIETGNVYEGCIITSDGLSAGATKCSLNITTISDNSAPIVTYLHPSNLSTHSLDNNMTLSATVTDIDLDNLTVWVFGNNTLLNTSYNVTNGSTVEYNWATLENGNYNWSIVANDGTVNSTVLVYYFTINKPNLGAGGPSGGGGVTTIPTTETASDERMRWEVIPTTQNLSVFPDQSIIGEISITNLLDENIIVSAVCQGLSCNKVNYSVNSIEILPKSSYKLKYEFSANDLRIGDIISFRTVLEESGHKKENFTSVINISYLGLLNNRFVGLIFLGLLGVIAGTLVSLLARFIIADLFGAKKNIRIVTTILFIIVFFSFFFWDNIIPFVVGFA